MPVRARWTQDACVANNNQYLVHNEAAAFVNRKAVAVQMEQLGQVWPFLKR